ncbi:hypothetical protein GCM10020000_78310 [Streptomyces olivoverticillatus]
MRPVRPPGRSLAVPGQEVHAAFCGESFGGERVQRLSDWVCAGADVVRWAVRVIPATGSCHPFGIMCHFE